MDLANTIRRATASASSVVANEGGLGKMLSGPTQAELSSAEGKTGFANTLDVFDSAKSRGMGGAANTILDKLGLPDVVGDVAGFVINMGEGNYIGAGANALDISESIARACGNDELAGKLTHVMDGYDTVSSIAGQIAMTVATGGAASTASVGGATVSTQGLVKSASMLKSGLQAGDKFAQGDHTGGAVAAFGALADFGPVGEMFGASDETLESVANIARHGAVISGFLDTAMADGTLTLSDIRHAPLSHMLDAAGIEFPNRDGALDLVRELVAGSSDGDSPDSLMRALVSRSAELATIPPGPQADALEHMASFIEQLSTEENRGVSNSLLNLVKQGALSARPLTLQDLHHPTVRG